ncbi:MULTISPECIES: 3-deoxy-D-manno-octulosonic acid kinase [Vibrio]|uniref:3-deoxy-D-manno-octulosonic acid kinase n=1 Tax=Vibrio TaxID=662 RepID=UPI0001B950CE|nr:MULTISPECIES: 3-deoxy-D-manno-octulosonic acid kinase [Vibrio]EEX30765.1 3-deoxy-D-manno-octulosonic acid kinase [Vibrio coralliilyticus ATCC BAA-450]MCM5509454.1 3-deoxy-D-manno-octulosonic acid kinase [Vibrio sp. SCSIO 43169]MDE3899581.1 3-deoxy-D-manno-octulosonic acid kinase [Vibrio sp. CC007]QFT34956.1 3-deoxy-D-manno-octulosonic acid kinase [Vibrio sp. THAF64]QGM32855.1 3-deoxy-D-manno-octulosonic acid kinase [Vibrio sp. THAF191d]
MKTVQLDNQTIWYDETLLKEDPKRVFDAGFWQNAGKVIGSAQGRGTTWFVQTETIEAALRHYRRGGLFGKLVEDSYLFSSWEKTRSYQEFQLLNTLIEAGVNVPRPIAARTVKSGVTYKADLLSEKIPNARDLVSILMEKPLPAEMYQKIGQEIRKMHDAQVNHTDLNIHNILIDEQDKVWIIDFDKCYQQSGNGWKLSNLDRLKRSFEKEVGKGGIHWKLDDFQHLKQ